MGVRAGLLVRPDFRILTLVLEETAETPLDRKKNKQTNNRGNSTRLLHGRIDDDETEVEIFWTYNEKI